MTPGVSFLSRVDSGALYGLLRVGFNGPESCFLIVQNSETPLTKYDNSKSHQEVPQIDQVWGIIVERVCVWRYRGNRGRE